MRECNDFCNVKNKICWVVYCHPKIHTHPISIFSCDRWQLLQLQIYQAIEREKKFNLYMKCSEMKWQPEDIYLMTLLLLDWVAYAFSLGPSHSQIN